MVRENPIGVTVFGDSMRAYTREYVNTPRWRWITRRDLRRRGHEMAWLWAWAKGELVDVWPYPPTCEMDMEVKRVWVGRDTTNDEGKNDGPHQP